MSLSTTTNSDDGFSKSSSLVSSPSNSSSSYKCAECNGYAPEELTVAVGLTDFKCIDNTGIYVLKKVPELQNCYFYSYNTCLTKPSAPEATDSWVYGDGISIILFLQEDGAFQARLCYSTSQSQSNPVGIRYFYTDAGDFSCNPTCENKFSLGVGGDNPYCTLGATSDGGQYGSSLQFLCTCSLCNDDIVTKPDTRYICVQIDGMKNIPGGLCTDCEKLNRSYTLEFIDDVSWCDILGQVGKCAWSTVREFCGRSIIVWVIWDYDNRNTDEACYNNGFQVYLYGGPSAGSYRVMTRWISGYGLPVFVPGMGPSTCLDGIPSDGSQYSFFPEDLSICDGRSATMRIYPGMNCENRSSFSLEWIKFTNKFMAEGPTNVPLDIKTVNSLQSVVSNYKDPNVPQISYNGDLVDWSRQSWASFERSRLICQKIGVPVDLQVRLNVTPKQSQRQLTLKAKMSYCSGKGAMGSLEGTAEIVPNADGVAIVSISGMKLPSRIATYSAIIFWSIIDDATGEKIQDLTMTQHKIFVTFDKPLDTCTMYPGPSNTITDKRLEAAIDACSSLSDNPDMYDVAKAIQEWLPKHLPWKDPDENLPPNAKKEPTSVDEWWSLVYKTDKDTPWRVKCGQYGCIHELMLQTLGIDAAYRHIFATEQDLWQDGKVRYMSASSPNSNMMQIIVDKHWFALVLDFKNELNTGEGAVRVGNQVYTEGGPDSQSRVIGKDNEVKIGSVNCPAELHALMRLADKYPAGRANLQRLACSDGWPSEKNGMLQVLQNAKDAEDEKGNKIDLSKIDLFYWPLP